MSATVYRNLLDEELWHRVANRQDSEAFSTLYKRYAHLAMGVGLKYLPINDAKDVVQIVFSKLWTDAAKHNVRHFKPWLYTVIKNHCLMVLRQQNNNHDLQMDNGAEFMEMFDAEHHKIEDERRLTILEACLETLRQEQKVCIESFYLQQKTYAEIASSFGMNNNQVKSFIQNGRRNLKICMDNKLQK